MNKINEIKIKNIKGILEKKIRFDSFYANKLTILVGRNGSGKTTLAHALKALNSKSIKLNKSDTYFSLDDVNTYPPEVSFDCFIDGTKFILTADKSKNEIRNKFIFEIISSQLKPKTIRLHFGGKSVSTSKIVVEDIEICSVLPKVNYVYSATKGKETFGKNISKFMSNLEWAFKKEKYVSKILSFVEFRELKTLKGYVNQFIADVEKVTNGKTTKEGLAAIDKFVTIDKLQNESHFNQVFEYITKCKDYDNLLLALFDCLQVIYMDYDEKLLKSYLCYLQNSNFINETKQLFDSINTSSNNPLVSKDGKLFLRIQDVEKYSNGERDLLCLASKLYSFFGSNSYAQQKVIVFDEIFDYLDGSNMLLFQYLISYFISYAKSKTQKVYFLALTHLDPYYFNNFILNKNIKVEYFEDNNFMEDNVELEDYIANRDSSSIKDDIDAHYLHYSPDLKEMNGTDCDEPFEENLINKYPTNNKFYDELKKCYMKYQNNQKFNITELCLWARIKAEKVLYESLETTARIDFLANHARDKIECAEKYIDVPEIIYLLSNVFNEGAHFKAEHKENKYKMLYMKLNTKSFHKLLKSLNELDNN